MRKVIIMIVITFLLCTGVVYAGQEEPCEHNNYIITFNSNEEAIRMFCNDCGESHNIKIDSFFI